MFVRNMRYIASQLGLFRGKDYSLTDLSNIFGIKRLTIHKWLNEEIKSPKRESLELICAKMQNPPYDWNITPNDLLNTNISKFYSLKDQKLKAEDIIKMMMKANLLDSNAICNRLKTLREERGWTYLDVSNKINALFTVKDDEQDYNVSHTHVRDMEKGIIKNFHTSKIIALASIYGVLVEYILYGATIPTETIVDSRKNLLMIPLSKKVAKLLSHKHVRDQYLKKSLKIIEVLEAMP